MSTISLKKQIVFVVIGILAMVAASRFPYHFWKRLAYPGIILSCVLLVILAVPGMGTTVGGARAVAQDRVLLVPGV